MTVGVLFVLKGNTMAVVSYLSIVALILCWCFCVWSWFCDIVLLASIFLRLIFGGYFYLTILAVKQKYNVQFLIQLHNKQ